MGGLPFVPKLTKMCCCDLRTGTKIWSIVLIVLVILTLILNFSIQGLIRAIICLIVYGLVVYALQFGKDNKLFFLPAIIFCIISVIWSVIVAIIFFLVPVVSVPLLISAALTVWYFLGVHSIYAEITEGVAPPASETV